MNPRTAALAVIGLCFVVMAANAFGPHNRPLVFATLMVMAIALAVFVVNLGRDAREADRRMLLAPLWCGWCEQRPADEEFGDGACSQKCADEMAYRREQLEDGRYFA